MGPEGAITWPPLEAGCNRRFGQNTNNIWFGTTRMIQFYYLIKLPALRSCGDSLAIELPSRGLLCRVLALGAGKATTALSAKHKNHIDASNIH